MEARPLALGLTGAAVRRAYATLFVVSAVLIGATLLSDLEAPFVANTMGRQLDLKLEGNAAVWFSSVVLLLAALAAGAVASAPRAGAGPARQLWTVVALFLLALSVDETAQVHEGVGRRFTSWFGTVPFLTEGTLPAFAWLLALLPLIVVFIVTVFAAVRSWPVPRRTRRLVTAGVGCWIGVLLAEFLQAQLMRWSLGRSVQGVIEEGLELTGAVLILVGFVELLREGNGRVCVSGANRGR
jgi:hypothetical protein